MSTQINTSNATGNMPTIGLQGTARILLAKLQTSLMKTYQEMQESNAKATQTQAQAAISSSKLLVAAALLGLVGAAVDAGIQAVGNVAGGVKLNSSEAEELKGLETKKDGIRDKSGGGDLTDTEPTGNVDPAMKMDRLTDDDRAELSKIDDDKDSVREKYKTKRAALTPMVTGIAGLGNSLSKISESQLQGASRIADTSSGIANSGKSDTTTAANAIVQFLDKMMQMNVVPQYRG